MLGIDDFWVWSAYVLCLLSALLCVGYGIAARLRPADPDERESDGLPTEGQ